MENFYPSICRNLFKESIEFARQFIHISDDDLSIIMQPRKTLLFDGKPKSGDKNFDVPMACYISKITEETLSNQPYSTQDF